MPEINDKTGVEDFLVVHPGIDMFEVMLPDLAGGLRGGFWWWQR